MPKAVKRMTGRKLQARRERWFRKAPLCVHCQRDGRVTPATQLDHIVALDNGGPDIESNLQGLCDDCHAIKTANDFGHVQRVGADASGLPASDKHHWMRGGKGVKILEPLKLETVGNICAQRCEIQRGV